MATEIWRDFDPNLALPPELKNTRVATLPDVQDDIPDRTAEIDFQQDTLADDDSQLNEDEADNELGVPSSFSIVSQTVRTGPDGRQVVDVVIDVEDVPGAANYEVRLAK